jgi:hypothetical protein
MKKPLSEMPNKWNKSHQIYTNDIESQIWFAFENLSGLQYLDSIIKKRINDDYVKNLTNSVVQNIKKKDAKRAELIEPLKDENVPYVLDEARNVILQSKDIYFAARPLSLLSKPIPLFYSFEKLAEFLYFLTYRKGKYTHGLVYDRAAHVIKICRNGLFANFHDSHSEDAFYLDEVSVRFEDIIECGPIYQVELDSLAWKKYTYTINTIDNKQVSITELDREFLFLYGLSILSRYDIQNWSKTLSGEKSPLSQNIKVTNHMRDFTRTVEVMFPSLILNEIYLMKLSIYSPMRLMAKEWEDYDDKALP